MTGMFSFRVWAPIKELCFDIGADQLQISGSTAIRTAAILKADVSSWSMFRARAPANP
jgi:hypothetical protein